MQLESFAMLGLEGFIASNLNEKLDVNDKQPTIAERGALSRDTKARDNEEYSDRELPPSWMSLSHIHVCSYS